MNKITRYESCLDSLREAIEDYSVLKGKYDDAIEALKAAQEHIVKLEPVWAKAEDLPPIVHHIHAVLARAK